MRFTKVLIIAVAIVGMFSFTSCTSYERGLVTGAVVGGVVGNTAANERNYTNQSSRNSRSYYSRGYRDGCRGYRQNNRYRNYSDYRRGWYNGRRECR